MMSEGHDIHSHHFDRIEKALPAPEPHLGFASSQPPVISFF
jgi:hypothetical protein